MDEFVTWLYLNEERIESWVSQLNGEVIKESKSTISRGGEVTGKLGIEIGNLLAKLGLGKATINGEKKSNYSTLLETTTTLSIINKVLFLKNYLMDHGQIQEINLFTATRDSVIRGINSSKHQILKGYFVKERLSSDRFIYKSIVKNVSGYPLVEIPAFYRYQILFQTPSPILVDGIPVDRIGAMVQCIENSGKFLATPLAIWFLY